MIDQYDADTIQHLSEYEKYQLSFHPERPKYLDYLSIGYGSRGIRLFESGAGNIGFSGKRVIEQYTGNPVSKDFQKTAWLTKNGHTDYVVPLIELKHLIKNIIGENITE